MHARSKFVFGSATVLLVAATLSACGDDSGSKASTDGSSVATGCATADLALKTAGKLKVATGEPAFLPWVEDDKPESGKGFESAVVYAIANQLGIAEADVSWARTGFDEAVAPGAKDYDFNVQQYSITEERKQVVDFSTGYYQVEQALVGRKDNAVASATSLADLKNAKLGAAIGSTSLDYIDNVIKPSSKAAVFDDNAAAKAAFDAKQVDALVFDVPTAYFITSVEITDSALVGVLPQVGAAEELGALFEKGSKLVGCVNEALAALKADGTLAKLEDEWLNQGGSIPTLKS
jgi:polar amino acid transport system substrate-binding protein